MKKILITGKNSYIGSEFFEWSMKNSNTVKIDFIDVKSDQWLDTSFSTYDVVLHLAGIVHQKKISDDVYTRVNTNLTKKIAEKSKKDGVKHFIFMSTMSIYGKNKGVISCDTPIIPKNAYGISKFNAENKLLELKDESFKISIVRPPIVYGDNCKGNFDKLRKLSLKIPFVPSFHNNRSMIFIENLILFLNYIIIKEIPGIFHPRDSEYVSTNEVILEFKKHNNKKILIVDLMISKLLLLDIPLIDKVFGDYTYEKNLHEISQEIIITDFKKNIRKIVGSEDK
ncbi:NAD-dependent epimerase/dehydratase family protein [Exiguobacterium sp. s91]|uniref:NAD-dependent epimerase/dehydratase family protein n=1 Tax=Exiguobacterium sp. s91 TaxID=2751199 RepID=UPI001BE6BD90|nr:NAD-dependent epimerase/dehydratase family protein [Exiguobacterium sp. s91]